MIMSEAELKKFIRDEIRSALNIILSGTAGENSGTTETIQNLWPGGPSYDERPIMRPYGLISRAPMDTLSVAARQGSDPGNYLVLGHRDAEPPEVDVGESALYSADGVMLQAKANGIFVGKGGSADKTLMLGDETNDFLGQLLDLIIAHVHPSPGSPANNVADFTQLKLDQPNLVSTTDGGL